MGTDAEVEPVPGYTTLGVVGRWEGTLLVRAQPSGSSASVLVQVPRRASGRVHAWLRHHAALATRASGPGLVRILGIVDLPAGPAVVMEDRGDATLSDWLGRWADRRIADLTAWVDTVGQLARGLASVHQAGIVHRALGPDHVLVSSEGTCALIGFGHASEMLRELQELVPVGSLHGWLPYMAPEQTGRMARGIDQRSDLYALGAIAFELWVGRPPFTGKDPLELVHSHLAHTPRFPDGAPPPPEVLASIVLKLLEKEPAHRYQSAESLAADLERVAADFRSGGTPVRFTLDQRHRERELGLNDTLVGRDEEVRRLGEALDGALKGDTRLAVVRGSSGIGKTSVALALQEPVLGRDGWFIRSKFEQYQRDVPHSGLSRALRVLSRWVVQLPSATYHQVIDGLRHALGDERAVLAEIEPSMQCLIGESVVPPALPGPETQLRQARAIQRFFRVVAALGSPLVLLLDDMQWSDADSVRLLRAALEGDDLRGLLVVACYRDDEIAPSHPFLSLVDDHRAQQSLAEIDVKPLARSDVYGILEAALVDAEAARSLEGPMWAHSEGSPLFVRAALEALRDARALEFDPDSRAWIVRHDRVDATLRTDDLDAIVANRLSLLEPSAREVLSTAAAVGSKFSASQVAQAVDRQPAEVMAQLRHGVEAGVIDMMRGVGEGAESDSPPARTEDVPAAQVDDALFFLFRHDRLQSAAYSLLNEAERERVHCRIGRSMLEGTDETDDLILLVVDHLNRAPSLFQSKDDRLELAELNARAAERAQGAGSYATASRCASFGLHLLGPSMWQENRELALRLHVLRAENAALVGDADAVERAAGAVTQHAAPVERVAAQKALVLVHAIQGRLDRAVEAGRMGLTWFDVDMPVDPTDADVKEAFAAALAALGDRDPRKLAELPPLEDARQHAIHELCGTLSAVAYIVNQRLFAWIMLRSLERFARFGNPPDAAFFAGCVGVIWMALTKDPAQAARFGDLAMALGERASLKAVRGRAYFIVGSAVSHWTHPYADGIDLLERSHPLLFDSGDLEFAGYALYNLCQHRLLAGEPLASLEPTVAEHLEDLERRKITTPARWTRVLLQLLHILRSGSGASVLQGAVLEREGFVRALHEAEDHTGLAILHIFSTWLALVQGDWAEARRAVLAARAWHHGLAEFPPGALFHFWQASVLLLQPDPAREREDAEGVEASLTLLRTFARHNDPVFGPKVALVEALLAAKQGRHGEAQDRFDQAVSGARSSGAPHDVALAAEWAAESALRWGKAGLAVDWARVAEDGYRRWGAAAAAERIRRRVRGASGQPLLWPGTTELGADRLELDFQSFVKASRITRSELDADVLPSRLLDVVLENAGATAGAIVYSKEKEWVLRFRGTEEEGEGEAETLDRSARVPRSLLRATLNGKAPISVEDVADEPWLAAEPRARELRSVLCLPIQHGGQLLGALYLENALVSRAFPEERVEALRVLCAQAAISMQNAMLFADLKASEERLRAIVSSNIDIIAIVDAARRFSFVSPAVREMLGYAPEELEGTQCLKWVHPDDMDSVANVLERLRVEAGAREVTLLRYRSKSGDWRMLEVTGRNHMDLPGVQGILLNSRDVTERMEAEHRLQQAQRLEALGQLTGGVAHDFNNLLTVIGGNLYLLSDELEPASPSRALAEQALRAAERGASLTRSLLAFSSQQPLRPGPVYLDRVVLELSALLERTLPSNVRLRLEDAPGLPPCHADEGQLQNVVLNLVVNARDAMPDGGEVSVRTRVVQVDAGAADAESVKPGTYLELSVADTGVGMPESVRQRVFEPFFTTKGPGKGTGLGLSMVYGFARQSGGTVRICSEAGAGTRVDVWLPRHRDGGRASKSPAPAGLVFGSVLLVEDDPDVRSAVEGMLTHLGLSVRVAADGSGARQQLAAHPEVSLVLSDMMLAGSTGPELVGELLSERPDLAVVFMSGQLPDLDGTSRQDGWPLLAKPFTRDELLAALAEAVGRRRTDAL